MLYGTVTHPAVISREELQLLEVLAVEEEEVEEPGVILKKRLVCSGREQGLVLRWGSCNLAKYALL